MNRGKLRESGVDPEQGILRMRGKTATYEKFLSAFPNDEHYANMIQAISEENFNTAYQNAHALKGMTGNLSMNELYHALVPLVEELQAGRGERIEELLAPVSEYYHKAVEAIRE